MPLSLGIASGAGFLKNPAEPRALGYRVNYVPNPSFEVDTTGWSSVSSATLARTTSEFNTGAASLSVTNAASSAAAYQFIPLVGGEGTYYISAYVKLASGNSAANYYIRQLQYEDTLSAGTVSTSNIGIQNLSYTGDWVRLSGSVTKQGSANFMTIRIVTNSSISGEIFYVDSVMLEKSNTLGSYFDGGSGGFWSGAANASFSGATPY
jgi:hypothetical protein